MTEQKNVYETRIRFKFYKKDEFKYLSHLDISRIMIRAIRRAELEIKYSQGYNPKPKIGFSPPTPLGVESMAADADFRSKKDYGKNRQSYEYSITGPLWLRTLYVLFG